MLYSHNGSYPTVLPNRIRLSDGKTRTDSSTFTAEELLDAGWFLVEEPPQTEYPNKIDWDGSSWVIREPNEAELNVQRIYIQSECVRKLEETDYKIIKALEAGADLDLVVVSYRQQLRDIYNSVTDLNVWNIEWPVLENNSEE